MFYCWFVYFHLFIHCQNFIYIMQYTLRITKVAKLFVTKSTQQVYKTTMSYMTDWYGVFDWL